MNRKLSRAMKMARKAVGLTQAELGERLNLKGATISSWENNNSDPDIDEFVKYCEICNVDFRELLNEAYGNPSDSKRAIDCTADEIEMIRKFRILDTRAQRVILRNLNAEYADITKVP